MRGWGLIVMGALWILVPGLIDTSAPISGLSVLGLFFVVWGAINMIRGVHNE